ncbi:MAG: hypothetical protein HRU70_08365 [Phycisphaeraceae bacterium]|nr:MAG: hypothetical protein HRU70_08365 [Phycisphaeraceae bacterium]
MLFSTDGGTVWNPIEYPPIRLEGDPPIQITRRYGELNDLGDSPYRVDKRTNSPAIAVDRSATPNIVYVAFYGRSAQGPEQEDRNTDVYIFRGTDNGRSWGNTPGEHYIHITDASLGIAPGLITTQGPDQCGLALAVDCTGALCLMFYDNRHDQAPPAYTNNRLDVYFIRVAWPSSGPWSLLSQARLTPTTFPAAPDLMMGDFFHLPVAGEAQRRLYPVYVAREPDGMGGWTPRNLYTHKITVNLCPAGPMGLRFRPEHAEPLARAVLEEKPDGDLNGDDRVDLEDLALLEYWISNDRGSR